MSQPQPQDIAAYQQQVRQFQPVFDIYQEDGTVLVSQELDGLVDTEVLFDRFIDAFNSSNNKRNFLDASEEFQAFKAKLDADPIPHAACMPIGLVRLPPKRRIKS